MDKKQFKEIILKVFKEGRINTDFTIYLLDRLYYKSNNIDIISQNKLAKSMEYIFELLGEGKVTTQHAITFLKHIQIPLDSHRIYLIESLAKKKITYDECYAFFYLV